MDNNKSHITRQKQQVIDWAQALFALPAFCILDTETTGLDDDAEIVEIAMIAQDGKTLINQLVKPTKRIPQEVIGIHGITNNEVKKAPSFKTVWPKVRKILKEYQTIVIYNADFDTRMLMQSCQKHGTTPKLNRFTWHCAMNQYAYFYGEWSDYWNGWKWQKLISAAHWAAEYLDCERHGAHRALNESIAETRFWSSKRWLSMTAPEKNRRHNLNQCQNIYLNLILILMKMFHFESTFLFLKP